MPTEDLPEIGFLSDASEKLKDVLGSLASQLHLDVGDALFGEGEEGDALYAILEGALEVSVLSHDGRKLSLDVMRKGELFGEISLFDPGERTATVAAVEPSTLLRIRNADVLREVKLTPELAIDLIQLAGRRMRWMHLQLREQVFLPLSTRLARKILHLSQNEAADPSLLKLSQTDLAGFVGATREAVSKTLSTWKRLGVVDSSRKGLTILDRDALEALAALDQDG